MIMYPHCSVERGTADTSQKGLTLYILHSVPLQNNTQAQKLIQLTFPQHHRPVYSPPITNSVNLFLTYTTPSTYTISHPNYLLSIPILILKLSTRTTPHHIDKFTPRFLK